jgi:predicted GIY-YIG superfamily endonuclease
MAGSEGFIAVYIMASGRHGTLYVGVTSNLPVRAAQHREGTLPGFTERYDVKSLVWFAQHDDIGTAIRGGATYSRRYSCSYPNHPVIAGRKSRRPKNSGP